MSSDHPPTHRQWPDPDLQDSSSNSYALSGKIMLASIIILFVVVVFLVILHLYARWYLLRLQINNTRRRINRRHRSGSTRIVFYVDNNPPPDSRGLDANVLKSLPLFVYSPEMSDNVTECAVCLSEFEEGETGRVLPKCKHGFHTECIDMWFFSNSTCPLCRSPVEAVETEMTGTTSFKPVQESESEPGSSTSVSSPVQPGGTTSFKRVDVRIDVPNRNELSAEGEFRLSSPSPGFRSPGSRLLSRIINMSRKSPAVSPSSGDGPSCVVPAAATELDIESAPESSRPASDR